MASSLFGEKNCGGLLETLLDRSWKRVWYLVLRKRISIMASFPKKDKKCDSEFATTRNASQV